MAAKAGLKSEIAKNLKAIREKSGVSREELAQKAKVTARYIYSLESGTRNVTIDTLERLAHSLKCSVCDFICHPTRPTRTSREAMDLVIEKLQRMRDEL